MWFFIAVAILLIVLMFLYVRNEKINSQIFCHSLKLKELMSLNKEIGFNNIGDSFVVQKHYDNKSYFYKIQPAYLMTAEIKSNIEGYSAHLEKIKENREKLEKYRCLIKQLRLREDNIDLQEFKISKSEYCDRENKLFDKNILYPTVDCYFKVYMSYSSPQGRVYESKYDVFNFDEICICLNSISRTRLDRRTYSHLNLVERGEVSDSLRYDILNRDGFKCVICGASANQGAYLHVDHILPISKGGKSIPSNLRTLCERCNIGKSDKIESDINSEISSDDNKSKDDGYDSYESYKKATNNNKLICLRCGGKLVRRVGKYGYFYGCSNYPKCKYTEHIHD